jgi:hypothetical protein
MRRTLYFTRSSMLFRFRAFSDLNESFSKVTPAAAFYPH